MFKRGLLSKYFLKKIYKIIFVNSNGLALLNGFMNSGTDDQPYPLITQDWSYCSSHLPKTETVVSLPFLLSFFILSIPLFKKKISFSPLLPLLLPHVNNCHTFSLSPPAGVWLVKSGGCWRSSQSCKWGSPPGWPRHTVVQVRKPATLPTKQRWERRGLCVLT